MVSARTSGVCVEQPWLPHIEYDVQDSHSVEMACAALIIVYIQHTHLGTITHALGLFRSRVKLEVWYIGTCRNRAFEDLL